VKQANLTGILFVAHWCGVKTKCPFSFNLPLKEKAMFAVCPECGLGGECSLTIVFGYEMDQDNIYTFICDSCGEKVVKTRYAGSAIGNNTITVCPFCECDSREHKIFEPVGV